MIRNSPVKPCCASGKALGVRVTPWPALIGRCALSVELDRNEELGRLRGVAVAGTHAEGRQTAPLSRPMRFARCVLMVGSDLVVSTGPLRSSAVQPDDAISLRHRLHTLPIITDGDPERFGAMRKDLRGSVFALPVRPSPYGSQRLHRPVLAAVARAAGAPPGLLRSLTL